MCMQNKESRWLLFNMDFYIWKLEFSSLTELQNEGKKYQYSDKYDMTTLKCSA